MSQGIADARSLRTNLSPHWGRVSAFQWGVVAAVHAGPPPTVDVKLDGSSLTTTGIYYVIGYSPTVNDVVVVARMVGPAQTAKFVLGTLSGNASGLSSGGTETVTGNLAVTGGETVGGSLAVTGNETVGGTRQTTGLDTGLVGFHDGRGIAGANVGAILAETTLGSAGTITFSSISQAFRGLRIGWSAKSNSGNGADVLAVRFNNDSTANYDDQVLGAAATVVSAARTNGGTSMRCGIVYGQASALFNGGWIEIRDYAQSNFRPTLTYQCYRNDGSANGVDIGAAAWRSVGPITRIDIFPLAGNFDVNSHFVLYGI